MGLGISEIENPTPKYFGWDCNFFLYLIKFALDFFEMITIAERFRDYIEVMYHDCLK